jgi:UDP-N-acetylmuramate-alanine ligase
MSKFTGVTRRLEYKGCYKGIKIYDDFAHHPTAIKASIAAIRS